ncbi:MAG TPA: DUF4262 domain-containing protein [Acidobacteriaceae bacterium]
MDKDMKPYETERTRYLRQCDLSDYESDLLNKVEEFGCMILHVQNPDEPRPSFSYTIGLPATRNIPELITCGLPRGVAQSALNSAADLLTEGITLTEGRHRDLLGDVDVEFRPVDPKWVSHLMNSSLWFHGNADFRCLQLIYPDLENRYPEEQGFNHYFDQPFLQADMQWRRIEQDFWARNDLKSSLFDWKFLCSPHTNAFLSQTVYDGKEAITYVSHDADDGAWQFLGDLMDAGGGPVLVCLHHPINSDPSLKELADLPLGWCAERTALWQPWVRREKTPEDDER